jgi:hypothetical protein
MLTAAVLAPVGGQDKKVPWEPSQVAIGAWQLAIRTGVRRQKQQSTPV